MSSNGGVNWQQVNTGLGRLDVRALVIDPLNPATLYASGAAGIFKTTNGGQNWQASNNSLTNSVIVKLAIDPSQPDRVYAGAVGTSNVGGRGSFLGGIFVSDNGGNSWQFSSVGLASRDVRAIAIDPQDPFLIYAGTFGRGLFQSTDGGLTWNSAVESINLGLDNPQVLDIEIDPDDNRSLVVATFTGGIYKTDDAGTNWRNVRRGGRFQEIVRDPVSTNILYATAFAEGVLKSTDNGDTWTQTTFSIQRTFPMAIDPVNPSTIYVGVNFPEPDGGVYKSTDGGATWDKKSTGITNSLIRALAVDPQNPDVLFAGSLRTSSVPPGIFKTTDGGENWQKVQTSFEFEPFVILIHPMNSNEIYSSNLEGILKSPDGGVSWQLINDGLISTAVLAMAFDPTDPNIVYAGTRGDAVFRVGF